MSIALSREPGRPRASTPIAHFALRRLLDAIGKPPITFVLWDGAEIGAEQGAVARVHVRDPRALWSLLRNPSLGFGEAYAAGGLVVEGDLAHTIEVVFRSSEHAPGIARYLIDALGARRRRNTRTRSRANVHHHYDLGNEFYARWLDADLVYTCAYFEDPRLSLEQAQRAKLDHVCRKLRLRSGERVLEAGCGWGALALHMAENYGVTVQAFNVSSEQIRFARAAALRRGLRRQVEFIEDDYRSAQGRFDAFVSVGMLEHVGRSHYASLGALIEQRLEPDGRGLLHFIGHARPWRMNPWIERNIFPGAYIPALSEVLPLLEQHGLAVADVENLRRHYALTLKHWLERFEQQSDWVESRYDSRFVRTWRLYLASSIAAFRSGSCQLFQVLFERAAGSALPWTRADLYAER
ncbi:MAG TPA: cyclopropane-fatty-acyl-phospholipid synthase family protein [Myxococcota bacterium]|nr:cyclopropane-fatty-acyl-phospholipid synthase family protein [Myxococcota bacterium]